MKLLWEQTMLLLLMCSHALYGDCGVSENMIKVAYL